MQLRLKDLEISSPVFSPWGNIPQRYTSDGENISPALKWSKIPAETKELALICIELLEAIADHVTAQARLVGTYQR